MKNLIICLILLVFANFTFADSSIIVHPCEGVEIYLTKDQNAFSTFSPTTTKWEHKITDSPLTLPFTSEELAAEKIVFFAIAWSKEKKKALGFTMVTMIGTIKHMIVITTKNANRRYTILSIPILNIPKSTVTMLPGGGIAYTTGTSASFSSHHSQSNSSVGVGLFS